jgi:hypothetical protein
MNNYPPGVSGNEPQITGIDPEDAVIDYTTVELKKVDASIDSLYGYVEEQGLPKEFLSHLETLMVAISNAIEAIPQLPEEPEYDEGGF